ncbi:MAG: hypothetical protein JW889_10680 [Verrucomicrobia bacterium]|nr:hypothetical protein [Verrucomicrobiota bacterium]
MRNDTRSLPALFRLVVVVGALCGAAFVSPRAGATTQYGDVTISARQPADIRWAHGYLEYEVTISNTSPNKSHTVALRLPEASVGGGDSIRRMTRTVSVGPASATRVSLFQPALPCDGYGLGVSIDGRRQREQVPIEGISRRIGGWGGYGSAYDESTMVLVSRGAPGDFENEARPAFETGGRSSGRSSYYGGSTNDAQFPRAESPVAEWSTSWLGHSACDAVVMSGSEWRDAPAPVKAALRQYVECGGTLAVLGPADMPETWRARTTVQGDWTVTFAGFGVMLVTDPDQSARGWSSDKWRVLRDAVSETYEPFRSMESVEGANDHFPVVEGLRTPVKGLMVLMVLFVVAIGPVNLIVLSRMKRRIWLLWTVPAISLLTCTAVTVYAAVAEGWSGRARIATLTVLDQASHRATTVGWAAFYSPVTPRDGLHFSADTELTPQIGEGGGGYGYGYRSYDRGRGRPRDIDWTEDQHLANGWVSARVPVHFIVRASEMRRERLTVSMETDGTPVVVNGLGADIRRLWYAAPDGTIYSGSDIAAGAQARLAPSQRIVRGLPVEGLRKAYVQDWLPSMVSFESAPAQVLMPGCYIAVVDDLVFIEPGLRNAKTKDYKSVIYGILGEDSDEG